MEKLRLSVPPRSKPSLCLFLSFLFSLITTGKKTIFPSLIKKTANFLLNHNSLTTPRNMKSLLLLIDKSMLLLPIPFSHPDLHLDLYTWKVLTFSFCSFKSCLIFAPLLRDTLSIHLGHENPHHILFGDQLFLALDHAYISST